jgi:DNA repair exonuclease SbcCD ATPase subunit
MPDGLGQDGWIVAERNGKAGLRATSAQPQRGRNMNEITELEGRIAAALGRIRRQVEAIGQTAPEPETAGGPAEGPDSAALIAELTARLDEEQTVNAQLEERVRALKDRQDGRLAELEAQSAAAAERLTRMDAELQRLQAVNADLRAVATEMRRALQDEVADPELVNRAAIAELDALRAARDADRVEVEAILTELVPLMGEGR